MNNNVNEVVNNSVNSKTKEIVFFIITIFAFMLFEIIWYALGIKYDDLSPRLKVLCMYAKYVVFIIIYIIRYRKYLIDKWKDFKNSFVKYAKVAIKWWFIGFLAMTIINTILGTFIQTAGENEEAVQSFLKSEPLLMFFATSLFAPIIEELMFRKSLQDCFKNKIIFIVASGFLFGLMHVIGSTNNLEYLFLLSYGAFGSAFAKCLVDTDNIYTTILAHMFHNTVLSLIAIIPVVMK